MICDTIYERNFGSIGSQRKSRVNRKLIWLTSKIQCNLFLCGGRRECIMSIFCSLIREECNTFHSQSTVKTLESASQLPYRHIQRQQLHYIGPVCKNPGFQALERFFRFDQSDRKMYKKAISDWVNVSVVLDCGFGSTSKVK